MKKIIAIILAAIMMLSICSCEAGGKSDTDTGTEAENNTEYDGTAVVASTENFEISFAEFDYIFANSVTSLINEYYNQYGEDYVNYIYSITGLNLNEPFKDQQMNDGSGSFFDYFVEISKEKAKDLLVFCEYAKENGIELDEQDQADIDSTIQYYEEQATTYECTVAEVAGDSMNLVTTDVLRSYAEKNILAGKGFEKLKSTFEVSEEEINKEFDENVNKYGFVNYLTYTFQADEENGITADDIKKYSEELSACTTENEFISYCENYHNNVLYKDSDTTPDFAKENLIKERYSYAEGTDYLDWMFNEAKVGDTKAFENKGDNYASYNVYMLIKEPSENEYSKVDFRHILFYSTNYETADACRKAAEEVYAAYKKNPTEVNFIALANKYSQDTHDDGTGNQVINSDGGLYSDVGYNEMVKDIETWIMDPARQGGDTDIVLSTYGYHIVYFVKAGEKIRPGHDAAENALLSNIYIEEHDKLLEKYSVSLSDELANSLNY